LVDIQNLIKRCSLPHKAIFVKTHLRNTFQFCEAEECFKTFSLVCKTWHSAVESTKFINQSLPQTLFKSPLSVEHLQKLLFSFKSLFFSETTFKQESFNAISSLILTNMKFLKQIRFQFFVEDLEFHPETNPDAFFTILNSFFVQLIQRNKESLKELESPFFTFPGLSNLELSHLNVYSTDLDAELDFNFDYFKSCMNKFELHGFPSNIIIKSMYESEISSFILENYKENSILGIFYPYLVPKEKEFYEIPYPKYLPIKFFVLQGKHSLYSLEWTKFPWEHGKEVEFLKIRATSISVFREKGLFQRLYKSFEDLINNLPNLKGVCIFVSFTGGLFKAGNPTLIFITECKKILKRHKIKYITDSQFHEKIEEFRKSLPFMFTFKSSHAY
jgi:hypothetical protein